MDKKLYYILGTVFIIAGGILYSLERFISYFSWIEQMNGHIGSFPIFIMIGVILLYQDVKSIIQCKISFIL